MLKLWRMSPSFTFRSIRRGVATRPKLRSAHPCASGRNVVRGAASRFLAWRRFFTISGGEFQTNTRQRISFPITPAATTRSTVQRRLHFRRVHHGERRVYESRLRAAAQPRCSSGRLRHRSAAATLAGPDMHSSRAWTPGGDWYKVLGSSGDAQATGLKASVVFCGRAI